MSPPPSPPGSPSPPPPPRAPPSLPPGELISALSDFYWALGGPNWTVQSNWLISEPCLAAWYGTACCPVSHPLLDGTIGDIGSQRCCARGVGGAALCNESSIPIIDSRERAAQHCAAGTRTGKTSDYTRCVLVKLELANNSLSGDLNRISTSLSSLYSSPSPLNLTAALDDRRQLLELPQWQRTFHDVQVFHVQHNQIHGQLPIWLHQLKHLQSLRLDSNHFDYDMPVHGRSGLDPLFARCRKGFNVRNEIVTCTGVPPESCSAFVPLAAVRKDHRHACVTCDTAPQAALASILVLPPVPWMVHSAGFALLLALFCALIVCANEQSRRRYEQPRHLRRWVAAISGEACSASAEFEVFRRLSDKDLKLLLSFRYLVTSQS